jgi:nicotinamidase-related amidase
MIADPVLLLVDFQNWFCKPAFGALPKDRVEDVQAAIDATSKFLERYRETGRTPIFTKTHHTIENTSSVWYSKHGAENIPCQPGAEESAIVQEFDSRNSDVIIDSKHRYSSFHNTDLETYLSTNDIEELLIGGISTNVCVESTVRSAYDRNYTTTVLSDCTAIFSPIHDDAAKEQARTLTRMDEKFGTVTDSSQIDLGSAEK